MSAKPTGRIVGDVSLTGTVFAWSDGPVLCCLGDAPDLYLFLFSDVDVLRAWMAKKQPGIAYTVKHVDDPREFLDSLPTKLDDVPLRVALDPTEPAHDVTRWLEIKREEDLS